MDRQRLHQFSNKLLSGTCAWSALHTGGWRSGDLLIAGWDGFEKNIASEVHVKRVKSQIEQDGHAEPRSLHLRLLRQEEDCAGGGSDARIQPPPFTIAGGTLQSVEREGTEDKDDF